MIVARTSSLMFWDVSSMFICGGLGKHTILHLPFVLGRGQGTEPVFAPFTDIGSVVHAGEIG